MTEKHTDKRTILIVDYNCNYLLKVTVNKVL